MKINDGPVSLPINLDAQAKAQAKAKAAYGSPGRVEASPPHKKRGDTVSISRSADSFRTAIEQIKALPEVDMEKVNRIKAMVKNGTYRAAPEDTARAMIFDSLIDEL